MWGPVVQGGDHPGGHPGSVPHSKNRPKKGQNDGFRRVFTTKTALSGGIKSPLLAQRMREKCSKVTKSAPNEHFCSTIVSLPDYRPLLTVLARNGAVLASFPLFSAVFRDSMPPNSMLSARVNHLFLPKVHFMLLSGRFGYFCLLNALR